MFNKKIVNFQKNCGHENQIEDVRQGDIICVECGLVIDQVYIFQQNNLAGLENYYQNYVNNQKKTFLDKKFDHLSQESETLATLCNKLHLDKSVQISINTFWEKIKNWHKKHSQKIKIDTNGLIVMSIYKGLIKENVSRPISHLCQELNVSPKIVWRWLKLYKQYENLTNVEKKIVM